VKNSYHAIQRCIIFFKSGLAVSDLRSIGLEKMLAQTWKECRYTPSSLYSSNYHAIKKHVFSRVFMWHRILDREDGKNVDTDILGVQICS
jgi:hypothetical protein